jgi:hypothetical protein
MRLKSDLISTVLNIAMERNYNKFEMDGFADKNDNHVYKGMVKDRRKITSNEEL